MREVSTALIFEETVLVSVNLVTLETKLGFYWSGPRNIDMNL